MAGGTSNNRGTISLNLEVGQFDIIFEDEKQNEHGPNLLLIASYLKPCSGLLVVFDDSEQTPPHMPSCLLLNQNRNDRSTTQVLVVNFAMQTCKKRKGLKIILERGSLREGLIGDKQFFCDQPTFRPKSHPYD